MAADEYTWNKKLKLSGNAVSLLKAALKEYQPEPWESSLREILLQKLADLESVKRS